MTSEKRPSRSGLAAGFLLGAAAAGAAAALAAVLWWQFGPWSSAATRIDTSRPTVVRQIQQLQRLQTVMYSLDKIVEGERVARFLPAFLAGERLLLIVYGEVTAGVDLGRIAATDVEVDGRFIQIAIPEAEIFTTRIDNERTRVYSRETGLFTRVDPNLESEVRREAEREVRQAAIDNGILASASSNARTTMASFLQGLGFDRVDVR